VIAVTARKTPAPEPAKCPVCKGSGEVSRVLRVGRKRRTVGRQTGLCLNCLGSGDAPTG
jgi:DnaJ-class molecular chaperone